MREERRLSTFGNPALRWLSSWLEYLPWVPGFLARYKVLNQIQAEHNEKK